jgi:mannose-1-phosphate guanylyltransferase
MSSATGTVPTPASDRYVVIMAGGRGERFWPISREATPKQLITLLGSRSFLQQAVDRVRPLVPAGNIFIITNSVQAGAVRRQLPELPAENVIAEPVGRDTCAAVALGAAVVGAKSTLAVMAVLPADHVIPEEEKFRQVLADAFAFASGSDAMVTIGIHPTSPETGYGYIRSGEPIAGTGVAGTCPTTLFKAEQFVEKPNLETAQKYLASGNYRWNAGMFIWSYQTVMDGLRTHQPDLYDAAVRWQQAAEAGRDSLNQLLAKDYPGIRKISVDFALMEKAHHVVVADGAFGWDDLGAWPALARHVPQDADGNAFVADVISVDAARNIVYDARKSHRSPITLVGVKDSIIVFADDAILVAAKSDAQKIKDLVKKLGGNPATAGLV